MGVVLRAAQVTAMVTVAVMTCLLVWNLLIAVHSLLLLRPAHDTWKTVSGWVGG